MPFLVDKGVTEELLAVWNVGSALWYRLFLVFANSFILKACCIPKILSLFQQQFWRSLLTSEITCLNDFVMLIPALTTLSTGVKFTVNWNITRAQEFCYKSLTLFIWSYIFACSLRNTSVKNKTKQKKSSNIYGVTYHIVTWSQCFCFCFLIAVLYWDYNKYWIIIFFNESKTSWNEDQFIKETELFYSNLSTRLLNDYNVLGHAVLLRVA